jgi:ABC-2 type transport system ATP-binding protein
MIEASGLTKTFGGRAVIDAVTLDVQARGCVLVRGAALAGKTTLLRLLAGVIAPTSGTVRIAGSHASSLDELRKHVALCDLSLAGGLRLRVEEYLRWLQHSRARGTSELTRQPAAPGLAARRAGLLPARRVDTLARDDRAALAVAAAAVVPAAVLLLDDVMDSFAVDRRRHLYEWMQELHADGATLILTSRRDDMPPSLFTRLLHLENGRVRESTSIEDSGELQSDTAKERSHGVANLA